jgi:hypothetical protein
MRITTNTKLIERQSKIARYSTFAGLGILLISLISSFLSIENILFSYISLFVGLILAYLGSLLANKWIREPRADKALEKALKGFDNKHHLYNYLLPAAHVLATPTGVVVFRVKSIDGEITCRDDKWKRARHFSQLLGGMGQEPLGNPTQELNVEIASIRKLLAEKSENAAQVPISGYVVFTAPKLELDIENASVPVVRTEQLKDTLRKGKQALALPQQLLSHVEKVLDEQANAKATQ